MKLDHRELLKGSSSVLDMLEGEMKNSNSERRRMAGRTNRTFHRYFK
jgi:hypothetical protein